MQLSLAILLSFVVPFSSTDEPSSTRRLIFVETIFRHGDRAPTKLPYPNDPYDESYWPRGWGQLTNEGMVQARDLGRYFMERYGGSLISTSYKPNEVYVRSSDSDRALSSAQAMLAGMFPPSGDQIWDPTLAWQPIPIHSASPDKDIPDPVGGDTLLRPSGFDCPKYDVNLAQENSHLKEEINRKYENFFAFLKNHTGMKTVDYSTVDGLHSIQQELLHGLPQPSWVTQPWPEFNSTVLELITRLKYLIRNAEFNSPEKARLKGGYLLGDWLKQLQKAADKSQKHRMIIYSAHDGTVLALMNVMNVSNGLLVPYVGCLILELYEKADGIREIEACGVRNPADCSSSHSSETMPGGQRLIIFSLILTSFVRSQFFALFI